MNRYYYTKYEKYEIPPEALADEQFAAIIKEAEKYLGYPYIWGGSGIEKELKVWYNELSLRLERHPARAYIIFLYGEPPYALRGRKLNYRVPCVQRACAVRAGNAARLECYKGRLGALRSYAPVEDDEQ